MTITLYQFSKRQNSTKQPTNSISHIDVTVFLKEPCDEFKPVFQLDAQYDTYNYLKWGTRYYWITSKTYITSDIIEIHCTKDLLATYKTAIGASSEYILRSSHSSDGTIIDNLYPITMSRTSSYEAIIKLADMWDARDGFYVMGLICSAQSGQSIANRLRRGNVVYLILTEAQARTLADQFNQLSGFMSAVKPADFLVSFTYIPIPVTGIASATPGSPAKIHIGSAVGGWDLDVADMAPYSSITGANGVYTYTPSTPFVQLDPHPDAGTRGQYLNYPPYTYLTAYLGPFGTVNLTQMETSYGGYDSLYYNFTIDLCTGQAVFRFYSQTPNTDLTGATVSRMGRLGVPIQLVTSTYGNLSSTVSAIGSAIGIIGGIATGNAALAGSSAAGFVGSAASSLTPKNDSVGSNGSFAELYRPYILAQFFKPTNDDNAQRGRPLCEVGQISNYPGYIMTSDCDIALLATDAENISIRNQMNAGFFYE